MSRKFSAFARVAALACFVSTVGVVDAEPQARQEIVKPTVAIARDSYKTWSLFLVCNPDWVSAERSRDLENLYWRFRSFGDAIGKENLAVWFWREQVSTTDPRLAEKVDVARSAEYCRVMGLTPSEGPHLVVTYEYPDLAKFPSKRIVFTFGGTAPSSLAKTLNAVTDQLLLTGKVQPLKTVTDQPSEAAVALGWLDIARQTFINLGCAFKVAVNLGPVNAELRGCSP